MKKIELLFIPSSGHFVVVFTSVHFLLFLFSHNSFPIPKSHIIPLWPNWSDLDLKKRKDSDD